MDSLFRIAIQYWILNYFVPNFTNLLKTVEKILKEIDHYWKTVKTTTWLLSELLFQIAAEKKAQALNEELKVSEAKIKSLSTDLDSAKQDLTNSQNLLSKLQVRQNLPSYLNSYTFSVMYNWLEQLKVWFSVTYGIILCSAFFLKGILMPTGIFTLHYLIHILFILIYFYLQNEEKRTIELEEKVTSMESQFRALEKLINEKDKELEVNGRWKHQSHIMLTGVNRCHLPEDNYLRTLIWKLNSQ